MWVLRGRCGFRALQRVESLDASDVTLDGALRGEGVVSSRMSVVSVAAFDWSLLGVHSDYVVHVRPDILYEIDGPMFRHGLQGSHWQRILVPSRRVDRAG